MVGGFVPMLKVKFKVKIKNDCILIFSNLHSYLLPENIKSYLKAAV